MQAFLNPRSVALIGATDRPDSIGRSILENLLSARDKREVYAVNPGRKEALGLRCYASPAELPEAVELAVIATPAATVPALVAACGEAGVRAVIIISAGFGETGESGRALEVALQTIARRYQMRILGPNCAGIIRPSTQLRATNLRATPEPGPIAFVSQSGSLGSTLLDWAIGARVGISFFASLGSMLDVDFGAIIDLLAEDQETRSLLLYMESVGDAKRFMSAARACAPIKPILVAKPGVFSESVRAMRSHTGAEVGRFEVYDAAFKRVGVVRVDELTELFACARILHSRHLPTGPRLAVITNGGGPGVMAADALSRCGGVLAELSLTTRQALDAALSECWSRANPIDLMANARTDSYRVALEACLADSEIDGIVVIHAPQVGISPTELAGQIATLARKRLKPILTVWMGDDEMRLAREHLAREKVPAFGTPEEAIAAFMHLVRYHQNLERLYTTPLELPIDPSPPQHHLRVAVRRARAEGRTDLAPEEASWFLTTYGIRCNPPVDAACDPRLPELTLAAFRDVDFGFSILLAKRDGSPDWAARRAVGLPPLHQATARSLIDELQLAEQLTAAGDTEAEVHMRDLETLLVRFAALLVDFPEFEAFEIGRLFFAPDGLWASAAAARLLAADTGGRRPLPHLVITPYPARYVTPWRLNDGTPVVLRPIRPEDESLEEALISGFSERTSRYRFFHVPREIDHVTLARFCNIDYGRELALIAEHTLDGQRHNIGVGRVSIRPDGRMAEFAIVVADAYQGKGLGTKLLDMLIGFCLEKGLEQLYGIILSDNEAMIRVARRLGFTIQREQNYVRAVLDLYPSQR